MRYSNIILFLWLAAGLAFAQTTNQAPDQGPDYSTFGQFIAVRNIFNPDRYPVSDTRPHASHAHVSPGVPYIALVGTMNYQKGMFAFFDGNNSDYKKVLQANGQIAGYIVKDITRSGVVLAATGTNSTQTNVLQLAIGAQLRQNGLGWDLISAGEAATTSTANDSTGSADSSPATTSGASDSSSAPNDILKRLMQKREQEMK